MFIRGAVYPFIDHPVYGAGVPEPFEFYVGRAINLATYPAASPIVIGDEARS